jgi:hypothetical protein
MEFSEFFVAVKRKVDVGGLQVRPTVALAVEDTVVGLVDVQTIVGPKLHRCRVHEGVSRSKQKHGDNAFKGLVGLQNFMMEGFAQML